MQRTKFGNDIWHYMEIDQINCTTKKNTKNVGKKKNDTVTVILPPLVFNYCTLTPYDIGIS